MKTVYVYLKDHQDPIWNKAFKRHLLADNGEVIRSYSEREELQYDRWLDILPGTGAKMELEQSCTVREYLRRNPERFEQLRALHENGQIEFLGCGESIIDYNMVHGESIYRNFLYGFLWLEQTFGVYPKVAAAFDTFGLSAQLPQIFTQFGFQWLPQYSRCFDVACSAMEIEELAGKPVKPFWRGLDGTLLCIRKNFADEGMPRVLDFVNYQYRPCPECGGHGCRFCDYAGTDLHVTQTGDTLDKIFENFARSDDEFLQVLSETEETIKHADYIDRIRQLGEVHGLKIEFVTHRDMLNNWIKPYLDKLDSGQVSSDEIDIRRETNPISPGSYVTRGVLKRDNRKLEHQLLSAEKFAAFASQLGKTYPTEAFAGMWRQMSLVQFHDSITASHPDGSFEDVRTIIRDVRRGSGKRLLESCRWIAAHLARPAGGEVATVAVFNPLVWSPERMEVEVVIPANAVNFADRGNIIGWRARGTDGKSVEVSSWKRVIMATEVVYSLKCLCHNLPSCGYATILCEPVIDSKDSAAAGMASDAISQDAEAAGLQQSRQFSVVSSEDTDLMDSVSSNRIENDRYTVSWDQRRLTGIFDKVLGRQVAGAGSCDLIAEDDIGCLWSTLKRFDNRVNMNDLADISVSAWQCSESGRAKLELTGKLANRMDWDIPESWNIDLYNSNNLIRNLGSDEAEVCIDSLDWKLELWLGCGTEQLQLRYTINCDSQNIRLITPVVLDFTTDKDRAWYEIPYGMIERNSHKPSEGVHMGPDGFWPAIHWVAANNSANNYSCGLLNRGVVSHRFVDGVMEVSLQRSPRLAPWSPRSAEINHNINPHARDFTTQVYEFAFVSGSGDIADNRFVHRGYEFNTEAVAILLDDPLLNKIRQRVKEGDQDVIELAASHSFVQCDSSNVIASSIKQAECSDDVIVRMTEVYGQLAELSPPNLPGKVFELSPMERDVSEVAGELTFRPFEIKTLKYGL